MTGNAPSSGKPPQAGKSSPRRWGRAQQESVNDPYHPAGKFREPSACPQCGAVFHLGRWQWGPAPASPASVICPACHRINDKVPAGIVSLNGSFVSTHKDEIRRLVKHQEDSEKVEHPLNRIMSLNEDIPDQIVISTTDIHLPRRIADALKRAYHGALTEYFDKDGYFVRIEWHRDS